MIGCGWLGVGGRVPNPGFGRTVRRPVDLQFAQVREKAGDRFSRNDAVFQICSTFSVLLEMLGLHARPSPADRTFDPPAARRTAVGASGNTDTDFTQKSWDHGVTHSANLIDKISWISLLDENKGFTKRWVGAGGRTRTDMGVKPARF